jgi:TPR repeat protein
MLWRLVFAVTVLLCSARLDAAEQGVTPSSGESEALTRGVDSYYQGRYGSAYRDLLPLANEGNARAQVRVAVMLRSGRGTKKDRSESKAWFQKAHGVVRREAERGVPWAQADLGYFFENGIIEKRSDDAAAKWYSEAAKREYPGAMTNLAVLYSSGRGVPEDQSRSIALFQKAAARGDAVAKRNLRALGVSVTTPVKLDQFDLAPRLGILGNQR